MYSRSKNPLLPHRGFAVLFAVLCLLRGSCCELKIHKVILFFFCAWKTTLLAFPTISRGGKNCTQPSMDVFLQVGRKSQAGISR